MTRDNLNLRSGRTAQRFNPAENKAPHPSQKPRAARRYRSCGPGAGPGSMDPGPENHASGATARAQAQASFPICAGPSCYRHANISGTSVLHARAYCRHDLQRPLGPPPQQAVMHCAVQPGRAHAPRFPTSVRPRAAPRCIVQLRTGRAGGRRRWRAQGKESVASRQASGLGTLPAHVAAVTMPRRVNSRREPSRADDGPPESRNGCRNGFDAIESGQSLAFRVERMSRDAFIPALVHFL